MTTEHGHPQVPDQIAPQSLNDYLEVMTKAVFQSGLSWQVVTSKWPGFQAGFQGFDVAAVAAMGDPAAFKSTREFAAWLGLVPRHSGTGGRVRILGISQAGG